MTDVWQPLGFETSTEFHGLTDGVPAWMAQSFWDWVKPHFMVYSGDGYYSNPNDDLSYDFDLELLRKTERVLRFMVPFNGDHLGQGMQQLRASSTQVGNEIRLADFLLSGTSIRTSSGHLENILFESGSAWMIGKRSGKVGLTRRVSEGVQTGAETVMRNSGVAGARLASAWNAAFGVEPDPSLAYSLAIKAVEDAAIPVVSAADATATLGKIIGKMKSEGDWSLPFQRPDKDFSTSDVLLAPLKALWSGQVDRHGGAETTTVITQEAAEVAVVLAVPLVHAFNSGLVRRGR